MLPVSTVKTICLTHSNFLALMGTTVVITAAATLWCSRGKRGFRCLWTCKKADKAPVSTSNSVVSNTEASSIVPAVDDILSYLCTSCGTEKYSSDQVAAKSSSTSSPYKMVILVRNDLNMGKGKVAAQCCHAVLAAFKSASGRQGEALKKWEREGQPKITLKIESEAEMIELMGKARLAGITAESIRDAGRTQVAAGTRTVCAIGPAPAKLIDTITGHLKLY